MAHRLADATSPYLRQHADNPVDWWPWCDEAFAEARRRNVPVMLSVGYAACHWCHVMAHESFEDPATAQLLNERFVSVKVDREERPDIDAVYMAATQAMTGRGGWPMTVFLDHDGHAFYAGTYFPPTQQPGLPSFTAVLTAVDEAWRMQPERVAAAASQLAETLERQTLWTTTVHEATYAEVVEAVARLAGEFDTRRGGFGAAPKFPATPVLEFLLRAHALAETAARKAPAAAPEDEANTEPNHVPQPERSYPPQAADSDAPPDPLAQPNGSDPTAHPTATLALTMATRTLAAMARGGIYDHLTGGFARYSVDADWVVPHFEKMLSDNAQLLRVYLHWWRATGDPLARRVAEETADFLLAELGTEEGGFASSLDADSDGREGAFAVWTPRQLEEVLGPEDGAWVARLCEVTARGTFEEGASVLQLPHDPDDPARWQRCRQALAEARGMRPQPARDDKVVAAWNGLAIAALAESGALLGRAELLSAAVTCAEHLHAVHWSADRHRLARVSLSGRVNPDAPGVLEDYADLAEGLLTLYQVTGHERWYLWAIDLLHVVLDRFRDGDGFFDTAADAPVLVRRPQDPTDGVAPSGWSAGANALVTAAALGAGDDFREAARQAVSALLPFAQRSPRFTGWAWTAVTALVAGPVQVAVVLPRQADTKPRGDDATGHPAGPVEDAGTLPDSPDRPRTATSQPTRSDSAAPLHLAALRSTSPGLVVAVGREASGVPLLQGRTALHDRSTAYPCRGFVCDLPVTTVAALEEAITR